MVNSEGRKRFPKNEIYLLTIAFYRQACHSIIELVLSRQESRTRSRSRNSGPMIGDHIRP
jgi:hypothetical protein